MDYDISEDETQPLKRRIIAIQGDYADESGWAKGGDETFLELANELVSKGFTETEAVNLLSSAYSAVSGEFGC